MSFRGSQFPDSRFPNQPNFPPSGSSSSIPSVNKRQSFSAISSSYLEKIDKLIPSENPNVQKFEKFTKQIEDLVDTYLGFAKPYVPFIGRFLIVATFLEDSSRILTQWKEQVYYLATYRHLYEWFVRLFLFLNVLSMVIGSVLVILRKRNEVATILLSAIVLTQGLVYGLFFEPVFFLRNVSVIGGLILSFSDSLVTDKRSLLMPGLPLMESKDNKKYFLLAGRIMLIVLFLAFTFTIKWSFVNVAMILFGLVGCSSIVIGYKTKFSAVILTVVLSLWNIVKNHYWTYRYKDGRRDFLKYEFFQTLSIVGGLLLIVNSGAGELSVDEKKKVF